MVTKQANVAASKLAGTVVASVSLSLLIALIMVAGLLAVRRAMGALTAPLSTTELIVAAAGAATAATTIRVACRASAAAHGGYALPTMALVLLTAVVWVPGTPALGLLAFLMIVGLEEAWAWRRLPMPWLHGRRSGHGKQDKDKALTNHVYLRRAERDDDLDAASPSALGDQACQHMSRWRTADGGDIVRGWFRVDFEPRQRIQIAHLAFCPPFEATPRLALEQVEGPPARIKDSSLLPYGARLEVRLDSAYEQPMSVTVQFEGQEMVESATPV